VLETNLHWDRSRRGSTTNYASWELSWVLLSSRVHLLLSREALWLAIPLLVVLWRPLVELLHWLLLHLATKCVRMLLLLREATREAAKGLAHRARSRLLLLLLRCRKSVSAARPACKPERVIHGSLLT